MGNNPSEMKNNTFANAINNLASGCSATLKSLAQRIPFSPLAQTSPATICAPQLMKMQAYSNRMAEALPASSYSPGNPLYPAHPLVLEINTESAGYYYSNNPFFSSPPRLHHSLVEPIYRIPPIRPTTQVQSAIDFFSISIDESHLSPREISLPLHSSVFGMNMMQRMALFPGSSRSRSRSNRYVLPLHRSSSSATDLPSSHKQPSRVENLNPIISALLKNDLGKTVLGVVVPMTTALLAIYKPGSSSLFVRFVAVALSIGYAATWNGILLRQTFPEFANLIEQVGVASVLVAFFAMLGTLLPVGLTWVTWLGCGLSLLPFILPFFINLYRP